MAIKTIYCANCGTPLEVTRMALPKIGRIISVVQPHECLDEPLDLNLEPLPLPNPKQDDKVKNENKFVQKLNDLTKPLDRREGDTMRKEKSTAPTGILNNLNILPNSNPEGDNYEPESED